jgi:hypothetical protein
MTINVNGLKLLAPRILPLAPAKDDSGMYEVLRPAFRGFGTEEWTLRSHFEETLTGYRHAVIRIAGQEGGFLGLVPVDPEKQTVYVEVDDLAEPISISERGIDAVWNTELLLESETLDQGRLEKVLEGAKQEKVPLRIAIFRRLYDQHRTGGRALHPLFRLLPWEVAFPTEGNAQDPNPDFEPSRSLKAWLIEVSRHLNPSGANYDPNKARELVRTVPWLESYFDFVPGGFAYQLTRVANALRSYVGSLSEQEKLEDNFKSLTEKVLDLVLEFRGTRKEFVPEDFRGLFVSIPDTLTRFLVSVSTGMRKTGRLERRVIDKLWRLRYEQALLAYDTKKQDAKFNDLRQRVRNLQEAVLAAERGRFFERSPEYLNKLLKDLAPTVEEIRAKFPKELLRDPSLIREDTDAQFWALVNSGQLLCGWTRLRFLEEARREEPLSVIDHSLEYFRYADALCHSVRDPKRKKAVLLKRYTDALLLKAEALSTNEKALRQVFDEASRLAAESGLDTSDEKLLEIRIAVKQDRYLPDGQAFENIVESLSNLMRKNPTNPEPYELLFELFSHRGDFERALGALTTQLREANSSGRLTGWFEYRIASFRLKTYLETRDPEVGERAVRDYGLVLKNQPTNLRGASGLILLFSELPEVNQRNAKSTLEEYLRPTDPSGGPILHTTLRLVLDMSLQGSISAIESETGALLVLVQGPDNLLEQAERKILTLRHRMACFVFEAISKEYFERGRVDPDGRNLTVSQRFIDIYSKYLQLAQAPPDAVILTRKVDIALARKEFGAARETIEVLEGLFPEDPIVRLKEMTLEKLTGNNEGAEKILREEAQSSHPAFRDQAARLALLRGDIAEAQKICEGLISQNKFDAYALSLQARIYLATGEEHWPAAFHHWLQALRLRSGSPDRMNRRFAIRTARSIAAICQLSHRNRRDILDSLSVALKTEGQRVTGFILEALSEMGVVDEELVRQVREDLDDAYDLVTVRQVAQFLTVRTIYLALELETSADAPRELLEHVRWCRGKRVLPEYAAGSKGAYRRALMKQLTRNPDNSALTVSMHSQAAQLMDADWRRLHDHIVQASRNQTDYYRKAYELSGSLIGKTDGEWASFTRSVVMDILGKIVSEEDSRDPKDFLREEPENIAEWDLGKLGVQVKNGKAAVVGWVDRDALEIFEKTFNHQREWQSVPEELVVQRRVEVSAIADANLFGKFGIRIKTESHSPDSYAYIDSFDAGRISEENHQDMLLSPDEQDLSLE